jgi:hypothetical protein
MIILGENVSKIISRRIIIRMRHVSNRLVKKIETHSMANILFRKSSHLWHNSEKYITATRATDENVIGHDKEASCIPVN